MQYLGGKHKQSKYIIDAIGSHIGVVDHDRYWVEPFVGGGNVLFRVPWTKRIGGDYNHELISMYQAIKDGWTPPSVVSEEEYRVARDQSKLDPTERSMPPYLIAFIGFACSFGGKWFGGYAHNSKGDNYAARGARVIERDRAAIEGTQFLFSDYRDLFIPERSIVYCDPPYANTTSYRDSFDSDQFWEWCEEMSEYHNVFVSEYEAPEGWSVIWAKDLPRTLNKNLPYRHTDKLFTKL